MRRLSAARLLGGWSALVVLVAIVFSIGTPLVGGAAFHASDVLQVWSPWREEAPHAYRPENGIVTDTVNAVMPARAVFRDRIHDGDFPLWTSEPAGGSPLGANPNASTLSPFTWVNLVVPLWYAPGLVKLLEMLAAVGFTFLFARRLGLGRPAALLGGLVFAFTGFQVAHTNWPQAQVGALIPALFWAVERGTVQRRPSAWWPVAPISAAMWLTGFPAVTLWAHVAAGIYGLVRVIKIDRPPVGRPAAETTEAPREVGVSRSRGQVVGHVAALGGLFALGIGIAAVQIFPFAVRLTHLPLEYRVEKDIGALPWETMITLVAPNAFGSPAHPGTPYFGPTHFVGLQAFVGVTALLLLIAAGIAARRVVLPRGVRPFLWVATAVCGMLIYVGGPLLTIHQMIPIVGSNQIGRLRSLLGFFVAMLAAVGLHALAERRLTGRVRLLAAAYVAFAGVVALVALPAWTAAEESGASRFVAGHFAWVAGIAVVGSAVVLLAAATRRDTVRMATIGVIVLLAATEAVAFAGPFWPRIPTDLFYPVTPAHEFVVDELGDDRLAAAYETFYPGTAGLYGFHSVTAHVLTPEPYAQLLTAMQPDVFRFNRTYPRLDATEEVATSPILDRLGARLFATAADDPVIGDVREIAAEQRLAQVDAGEVLEAEIPPGPLRAVRLSVAGPSRPEAATWLDVEIHDADGRIVAEGRRRIHERDRLGLFDIGVLPTADWPEAVDDAPWRMLVRIDASDGHAVIGVDAEGRPALALVTPRDDGLELVFTRGAHIYDRLDALPRFRWATSATTIDDPQARVETLLRGVAPETVVLSGDVGDDAALPRTGTRGADGDAGAVARIDVIEGSGDVIALRVDADAPGWLVIADSVQDGWRAELNGELVDLLEADHAFGAVHVPAGTHEVRLVYRPGGLIPGAAVSVLALIALIALIRRASRPLENFPG